MSESLRDLIVSIDFNDVDIDTLLRVDDVMNEIESNLSGLTGSLSSSLSGMNQLGNSADNLAGGLTDATSGMTDLTQDISQAENEMDDLTQAADDLADITQDATGEMDDLTQDISQAENEMDDLVDSSEQLTGEIAQADQKAGGLGSTLKKVMGVLAAAFAVDKVKDFGGAIIESAAAAKAMTAQYEQVFGDLQSGADETLTKMGDSFGMVPGRLKGPLTQTTSMFKGLGLETVDAMGQAEKAVTIAADAAAFYDKSYEDANAALGSFIKGNYEGGESIGLFANETQLAAWAARELDVDWKKLGEADKQMARLEFAKTMQTAAGATGQAARESDSYENQLGNLKQTWEDFKALLGGALLEPFVAALQDASKWMQGIDPAQIQKVSEFIATTFVEGIQLGKDAFDVLNDTFQWLLDNKDPILAAGAGILGAIVAFQVITGVSAAIGAFNTLLAAYRAGTMLATAAQMGFNVALLSNPITWVVVAIGALIAIGVLLWQNWDVVKLKAGELWEKTKEVFSGIYDWGMEKIQPVTQFFSDLGSKFGEFVEKITNFKLPAWVTGIGDKIGGAISKMTGGGPAPDGSHATGLESVPFDGYMAELHKDEAVLTATQSDALRAAGILSKRGDKPIVNMQNPGPQQAPPPPGDFPDMPDFSPGPAAAPSNVTFAPSINITVDGSGGNLDEQTIAQLVKDETNRQLETFWRRMNLKQA